MHFGHTRILENDRRFELSRGPLVAPPVPVADTAAMMKAVFSQTEVEADEPRVVSTGRPPLEVQAEKPKKGKIDPIMRIDPMMRIELEAFVKDEDAKFQAAEDSDLPV